MAISLSRTNLPQITSESKIDMTGSDGFSILVSVVSPDGTKNQPGFTPIESSYLFGTQKIDQTTGFAKEAGLILSAATIVNNSTFNKISRTKLVESGGAVLLYFSKESLQGRQNIWGNQNISAQPTYGGWVNPLHYITNPDDLNQKTGLPKELGDFPFNYNDKFGANYFNQSGPGLGTTNLKLTTPKNKVDGPDNDGINSKKEVFQQFNAVKGDNIRFGGLEQYDFVHLQDRLQALNDPQHISNDVYLASFVEVKDHEDPVMFSFDLLIDFETSPLFNGAVMDFINRNGILSTEIAARKDIYMNFVNQFKRYFKLKTTQDPTNIAGFTGSDTSNILPVGNPPQNNRPVIKTWYLKKITGLDNLTEGVVVPASETIKSMVDYGKDLIKLTLYEDVTVNTGYLAMLYKLLSWSRLNGKQMIPENLLRFDCKIVINEVRNYNRVVKKDGGLEFYADEMNKYIYGLYECQFIFDKLSHGDEIDMWDLKVDKEFDIAFNYKYSNLLFEKFWSNRPDGSTKWSFDNRLQTPLSPPVISKPKPWDKISPNPADATSEITEAAIRGAQRQASDGALVRDTNPIGQDQPQGPEVNTRNLTGVAPNNFGRNNNSLEDARLTDRYRAAGTTPGQGAFERFENSEESSLERVTRLDRNRELTSSLLSSLQRQNILDIDARRRLMRRTFDVVIEGFEYLYIGAGDPTPTEPISPTEQVFRRQQAITPRPNQTAFTPNPGVNIGIVPNNTRGAFGRNG